MHYSDETILEGIRLRRKAVLEYVYDECYPLIRNLIVKNNGEDEDVQDVFQDAMVIVFGKLKRDGLVLECSFKTYLYCVCHHLWLQKLERRKKFDKAFKNIAQTTELSEDELIEIYEQEDEKLRLYQKHFLSLASDCQEILKLSLKKLSIGELQIAMGYKTEKYTKVKKFRCKEELKRRIMNDSDYQLLI